jgi:hypothetical protein
VQCNASKHLLSTGSESIVTNSRRTSHFAIQPKNYLRTDEPKRQTPEAIQRFADWLLPPPV